MTSQKDFKPKCSSKRKTQVATSSLQTLQKVQNLWVQEFTAVKNTEKVYSGHLAWGKQWLKEVVTQGVESKETSQGILTAEFAKAFDKPPNQFSVTALEMFLVKKCFNQNCGKDTAEGIHGAFAAYWDTMYALIYCKTDNLKGLTYWKSREGDKYAGTYSLDKDTGKIHGCPARAPAIAAVIHVDCVHFWRELQQLEITLRQWH